MAEAVRSVEITVEIDTNKQTYKRTFEDFDKAKEWCESILEQIP